ncbi:TetR/AcrR family transcriptional regulator [Crenobacter sp. SG2303]|uniref:TetR/AcrR family transcriptional regulator n=2 Tax=Crenobacter oryzisoli TaxID=3056844 RepID=A0ABT7XV43_9NEIS|nr:TetR/AcrR family transcriptional regulator [Crenobacter sp. SG2305]MDN0077667.1 TetR/AcrR family transcriptional regulator [Crenobacter sp. SG2303]MDN0085630.1 TetR/AcrR family transcriptional regulator [Crenobacter sp. SG2305]
MTNAIQVKNNPVLTLLNSAEAVFAKKGLAGSTTAEIAKLAGMPKATLHYHFRTKEALYLQVLQSIFTEWYQAAASFDEEDDPAKAIAGYVRSKMEMSWRRPNGSKVWAQEIISGAPHLRALLQGEVKPWMEGRAAKIRTWVEADRIAPVQPEILLFMIWAVTQHYADFEAQIRLLTDQKRLGKSWFTEAIEQVVSLVLRSVGLGPN